MTCKLTWILLGTLLSAGLAGCGDDEEFCSGNNCVCASGGSCTMSCPNSSSCDIQCTAGSTCTASCGASTASCDVECSSASSCQVDCAIASNCDVTCPANCTVRNCTLGDGCDVVCGLVGLATQSGANAVCGAG